MKLIHQHIVPKYRYFAPNERYNLQDKLILPSWRGLPSLFSPLLFSIHPFIQLITALKLHTLRHVRNHVREKLKSPSRWDWWSYTDNLKLFLYILLFSMFIVSFSAYFENGHNIVIWNNNFVLYNSNKYISPQKEVLRCYFCFYYPHYFYLFLLLEDLNKPWDSFIKLHEC